MFNCNLVKDMIIFRFLLPLCVAFPLLVALNAPTDAASTAHWNQWRGPNRDGKLGGIGQINWPRRLDEEHLKLGWQVELGPSYSGPISDGKRIFVTETQNATHESVRAYDLSSGRQQWQTRWQGAMKVPFFAGQNGSWIRSTPAVDDQNVYVAGIRDVLVCLNRKTGDEVWRKDFVQEFGTALPSFGFVCSPLIDSDFVYTQAGASVVKLDKHSGRVVWRTLNDNGGMFASAFSSPYMTTLAGRKQLLVQTRRELCGVDPETGTPLWRRQIPAFRGMNILTPTAFGDFVFTSSYGGKSLLFQVVTDRSNKLDVGEKWQNKTQGYMSSPIIIDGNVYLHLRNQRFVSIDLQTGQENWISRPFGKYWSMVARDNMILSLDERGELFLIRANPKKLEILDRRTVSDQPTWAHLAICANRVCVRSLNGVSVFDWK